MSLPIWDTKEEIVDTIIDCNCLNCPEFAKDLLQSECICDSVTDLLETNGINYEEIGHLFEKIRVYYLENMIKIE